jgi:hypothetical protein
MRNLCDKAPEAARCLATTILEFSDINNGPQDGIEGPQQKSAWLGNSAIQSTKRKSVSSKDLSYRPPKSAKVKAEKTNSLDKPGQPEDESKFQTDGSAQDNVPDGVQPPIQDEEGTTTHRTAMSSCMKSSQVTVSMPLGMMCHGYSINNSLSRRMTLSRRGRKQQITKTQSRLRWTRK